MRTIKPCFLCAIYVIASFPAVAGEAITYFHSDLVRSPIAATDQAGYVRWRAAYRPYGDRDQTASEQLASADNKKWFTGHVHDEETGLTYAGARYYDPALGRFLSVDPAGFDAAKEQTFGRYIYANNNPYKFVDPDGREVVVNDPAQAAYFEGLIMGLAAGVFRFDGSGKLQVQQREAGSLSGVRSAYYRDRLIEAINAEGTIALGKTGFYRDQNGRIVDVDLRGGGTTELFPEGDANVVVSGNPNNLELNVAGLPLDADAAHILLHELLGHAIPHVAGSDTGNAVDNENKARGELRAPLRAPERDPE